MITTKNNFCLKIRLCALIILLYPVCNVQDIMAMELPAGNEVSIYISSKGNDHQRGSIDKPFKTLTHAMEIVYRLSNKRIPKINIYLRGGEYSLKSTLTIDVKKLNHSNLLITAYHNEKVIIGGGFHVGKWLLHDSAKGIYKSFIGKGLSFRQLYFGDKGKAIRAQEVFPLSCSLDNQKVSALFPHHDIMKNQSQVELVSNVQWTQTRALVSHIERRGDSCLFYMKQPYYSQVRHLHTMAYFDAPAWIESAYELIDKPNEWYYDSSSGFLYFKPENKECLSERTYTVPLLEQLVVIQGEDADNNNCVQFVGVTFSGMTWNEPSYRGLATIQANQLVALNTDSRKKIGVPGAAEIRGCRNVIFDRCNFEQLGGTGINVVHAKDCKIMNCRFMNISSTAIQLYGDVDIPFPKDKEICENIEIGNNRLDDVSNEYYGGVGIFVGYARNIYIHHNELSNLPYSAISVGWGWGASPSICRNNRIENNYIHEYLSKLRDGAAIYTLGEQPNSTCSGNWIRNMVRQEWGGGMYFDEGSAGYKVQNNVIDNVLNWVFCHKAHNITISNNYSKVRDVLFIKSKHCVMVDNHNVYTTEWPDSAIRIMNNAGVPGDTSSYEWNRFICLGNSLTAGARGEGVTYPLSLQEMSGIEALNMGIGGQTSTQIAARFGAIPIHVSLENNMIPKEGTVNIISKDINILYDSGHFWGESSGSLCGVKGVITTDELGNWTFHRLTSGEAIPCPPGSVFIPDEKYSKSDFFILWLGRNNFGDTYTVLSDLKACTDKIRKMGCGFVVMAVLNGDNPGEGRGGAAYEQLLKLNNKIKERYPDQSVDIRRDIVNAYRTDEEADRKCYAKDIPPISLRGDAVHLNKVGYRMVAQILYRYILQHHLVSE
jgi:hypothetical protein